ncbi:hypothetical protein RclHR1_05110010 [Rhizophagus clarus]|uniref:Uncharacterized protein n=1 Tax=Rhizophagus clarus TaxID=94130 RepID=A0A2Z6SDW0_9GLOM|nr:hypothetical protein RclHR1_05110010 [Rhizophagus clarus]GES98968.1 hypothetical protein GLOIN_2v812018 [Rhizophagus clarus]
MNLNNHTTQNDFNLQMDQTAPLQFLGNDDIQHNNVEMSNTTLNISNTVPQDTVFEFYLPLPNDTIYHITYQFTKLHTSEIARRLNNGINLSHITDHQLPHHYYIHSLIKQQILPVDYQRNSIQLQPLDSTPQAYVDNNIITNATLNETTYDMQDTGYDGIPPN